MTAKGYKGIMVKEEVAAQVRAKAKAEGKTITAFLGEVLERYDKGAAVLDISNKSILRLEADIREIMQEVLEDLNR